MSTDMNAHCSCGVRLSTVPPEVHTRTPNYEKHGATFCPHCDRPQHPTATEREACGNCRQYNRTTR